jgi:4-aminobutyrate--pyruvate transaminase
MPGDIIGFCPPLIIAPDEIDEMFNRFTNALNETARQIKQEGASAAQ